MHAHRLDHDALTLGLEAETHRTGSGARPSSLPAQRIVAGPMVMTIAPGWSSAMSAPIASQSYSRPAEPAPSNHSSYSSP